MDENRDTRFLLTRRTVLETATATAGLCAGLPQVAFGAGPGDAEPASAPVTIELQVNGRLHILRENGPPILSLAGSTPHYDKRLIHLAFPLRMVIQS
jgi:hypothetical protein